MRHRRWVRWGLLAVPAGLLLWLAIRLRGMDAGDILSWTPRRPLAAALFLLGLYTVKGLTFLFPLSVLQAAAGLLFPPWTALAVSLLGTAVSTTAAFVLGRRQRGRLDRLLDRYPRLALLKRAGDGRSDGLLVFLVRLGGMLPSDAVSVFFGASGIRYSTYLPAGLAGMLPHLAAGTFLGTALASRSLPALLTAGGINAAVTVSALAVWRAYRRNA